MSGTHIGEKKTTQKIFEEYGAVYRIYVEVYIGIHWYTLVYGILAKGDWIDLVSFIGGVVLGTYGDIW